MTVVKPAEEKFGTVTYGFRQDVMKRLDNASANDVSHQDLMAAILRQVPDDEKFVLKIEK